MPNFVNVRAIKAHLWFIGQGVAIVAFILALTAIASQGWRGLNTTANSNLSITTQLSLVNYYSKISGCVAPSCTRLNANMSILAAYNECKATTGFCQDFSGGARNNVIVPRCVINCSKLYYIGVGGILVLLFNSLGCVLYILGVVYSFLVLPNRTALFKKTRYMAPSILMFSTLLFLVSSVIYSKYSEDPALCLNNQQLIDAAEKSTSYLLKHSNCPIRYSFILNAVSLILQSLAFPLMLFHQEAIDALAPLKSVLSTVS
eukprot:Platyproteum_vivax@DN995_c0_g1_i1.p1